MVDLRLAVEKLDDGGIAGTVAKKMVDAVAPGDRPDADLREMVEDLTNAGEIVQLVLEPL